VERKNCGRGVSTESPEALAVSKATDMDVKFGRRKTTYRGFDLTLGAGVRFEVIDKKTDTYRARFIRRHK
jgi:hypothetical protein